MSLEQMTPHQRLTAVLLLALTAPSDELATEVSEFADVLARGLSESEIGTCKSIALAFFHAGTDFDEAVGVAS